MIAHDLRCPTWARPWDPADCTCRDAAGHAPRLPEGTRAELHTPVALACDIDLEAS